MTPRELAAHIQRLSARELVELNRLLRDLPGWGGGVREPRRPRPRRPLDATGISLDAPKGKTDDRGETVSL